MVLLLLSLLLYATTRCEEPFAVISSLGVLFFTFSVIPVMSPLPSVAFTVAASTASIWPRNELLALARCKVLLKKLKKNK